MSQIVNLKTDLKSLRYGNDRRGGGSSGQPYITNSIPRGEGPGLGDYDFLVRGGSLLPGAVANDVSRLTQMLFDLKSPNGLLFTAKQNILSRSGVNIKAESNSSRNIFNNPNKLPLNNGIYLPTSTLAQTAVNPIGGHLLKQGINPTFDTSEAAARGNVGGIFSFLTGNSLPLSNPIYFETTAFKERIENKKSSRLIQFFKKNIKISSNTLLYEYSGGPGSTVGVGKTEINSLVDQRTGRNNPNLGGTPDGSNQFFATEVNFGYYDYSVFKRPSINFNGARYFNGNDLSKLYENLTGTNLLGVDIFKTTNNTIDGSRIGNVGQSVYQNGFQSNTPTVKGLENTLDYNQLMETGNSGSIDNKIQNDFRSKIKGLNYPKSPSYNDPAKIIEGRVNLGNPGKSLPPNANYVNGNNEALDKLNALPLYKSINVDTDKDKNDLCKFRIGVISNDEPNQKTYIHFRAFLDAMDDSYTADWQPQKFSGRAENLYNYQGFDRKFNLAWTVAAQSKQELIPMYQKLNYLASVCAPDYSNDGYMRGNLITLTVGGYLYEQVGIMTGINYTVPMESPWEIAINETGGSDPSVKELPFIIKVSGFSFIPIHNFVPSIQKNKYWDYNNEGEFVNGEVKIFGNQRYIALKNIENENYNNIKSATVTAGSSTPGIVNGSDFNTI